MENINWNDYEFKKMEVRKGIPVYLNVYSITPVNYFFQTLGLGIYHTGVEIQEREYSFGSTDKDFSGVIAIRPGSLGFALKEKLYLGNSLLTPDEIRYLAYLISFVWRGLSYDPFNKNCNFFTKFFAECLLKSSVSFPNYINRFTKFRTLFHCFYKPFKILVGDVVQMKPESSNAKEPEKVEKPSEQVSSEKKSEKVGDTISESSHNDTSKEELKKKKKRKILRSRINRRMKRYRIKDTINIEDLHLVVNKEKLQNQSQENHLPTSKTKVLNHNDFFKNFNQNIFSKFESNLLSEVIPLKAAPRLFLDESGQNTYLKELHFLTDLTINRSIYEKIEDIVMNINKKAQEKSFSLQKRKLFFLNSLAKYMKIAKKLCCVEKNYEKALTYYKYCVEIIDELLHTVNIKRCESDHKNSKTSILRVEEIDLIGGEENKEINEKSIQIEITQEELSEYSSFHDNKEFLISTQIKLYHSIIYCNQRLFLFNEIFYYCDRILVLDHLDWVARLKRGLFYYFSHDLKNAEVDFKLAIEGCPHKEDLKYELDKLS